MFSFYIPSAPAEKQDLGFQNYYLVKWIQRDVI